MTQPEARLQRRIQVYLRTQGAFAFKVHGSEYMMAGLPDLVVCWGGAFVGIEVKMPGCVPTERQLYVHDLITRAGGVVIVPTAVEEVRQWVSLHLPRATGIACIEDPCRASLCARPSTS